MAEQFIQMPRGDIRNVKFCVRAGNDLVTDFTEIYFTVKDNFRRENVKFQKKLSDGDITLGEDNYYHFVIQPEDTNGEDFGTYVFDIEVVKNDEIKQTTIGTFKITEEATYASNE